MGIGDITRKFTATTPRAVSSPLRSHDHSSPLLQQCFKLLDLLPPWRLSSLCSFTEMHSLLPCNVNVLFNWMFLHRLPDTVCNTLMKHGHIEPSEFAFTADILAHYSTGHSCGRHDSTHLSAAAPPSLGRFGYMTFILHTLASPNRVCVLLLLHAILPSPQHCGQLLFLATIIHLLLVPLQLRQSSPKITATLLLAQIFQLLVDSLFLGIFFPFIVSTLMISSSSANATPNISTTYIVSLCPCCQ
jgi:hypothetical protein